MGRFQDAAHNMRRSLNSNMAQVKVRGVLPVQGQWRMAAPSRCHSRSRSRRDAAEEAEEEEGDGAVQVVSSFSDEILCTLQLPRSGTVLDIKRRVQTTHQGINIFRQRLIIAPAGPHIWFKKKKM